MLHYFLSAAAVSFSCQAWALISHRSGGETHDSCCDVTNIYLAEWKSDALHLKPISRSHRERSLTTVSSYLADEGHGSCWAVVVPPREDLVQQGLFWCKSMCNYAYTRLHVTGFPILGRSRWLIVECGRKYYYGILIGNLCHLAFGLRRLHRG